MAVEADTPDVRAQLDDFLGRLRGDHVAYFPVRHHSPACAWHLTRQIREIQPASILIEGPETFGRFLTHLVDPELQPPIAVYTQVVEQRGENDERRSGAFYPLCRTSPEWVALREGAAVGARLAFCDLDYPSQVQARAAQDADRLTSLLAEPYWRESDYLAALTRRRGCRDVDELWDRLFEVEIRSSAIEDFVREVAAYGYMIRLHASPERLERDGTLRREAHMAQCVERERRRLRRAGETRPLLVVTGAFHTPALALGWARDVAERSSTRGRNAPASEVQVLEVLVPYSFRQLDALSGYAAGMPSPGYYQRVWDCDADTAAGCLETVALEVLAELLGQLRQTETSLRLSTADAIVAWTQARLLAKARGHPGPLREDLLDGMRSGLVKGELDVDGRRVLEIALESMRGDAVGHLPAGVELHPLVADFRTQAATLRLDWTTTTPRRLALDIYRKPRHREISRLFHRLAFLDVPYARFTRGPDFVAGRDLDLRIEHWTCAWSPHTESALVDRSIFGATLDEACVGVLRQRLDRWRDEGGALGPPEAVRALVLSLRLGLSADLGQLIDAVDERLDAESSLPRCVEAAATLRALMRFPGPFERPPMPVIERLATAAYQRSCWLVRDLPQGSEAEWIDALDALAELRELVVESSAQEGDSAGSSSLDGELLWQAAAAVLATPDVPEILRGGLIGLLFSVGGLDADALERQIRAGLTGSREGTHTAPAFLHGLFALCRELSWQSPTIMRRLDALVTSWSDAEFDRVLPFLRLAFARHTPRETDRVAELLAGLHGGDAVVDWYERRYDEAFVLANVALAARVAECLQRDGLDHFLPDEETR